MNTYQQMLERYKSGALPWDEQSPPPEVSALADVLKPGKALDLGCGYGRSAIFLASRGWRVDGVDFIPQAVKEAAVRAAQAGVAERIVFYQASVSDLSFLTGEYDLALDIGCMHALEDEALAKYEAGIARLLRPDGVYLLFARLLPINVLADDGPRGISEALVHRLFAENFKLEKTEHGVTHVQDQPAWESAWFWFRRKN